MRDSRLLINLCKYHPGYPGLKLELISISTTPLPEIILPGDSADFLLVNRFVPDDLDNKMTTRWIYMRLVLKNIDGLMTGLKPVIAIFRTAKLYSCISYQILGKRFKTSLMSDELIKFRNCRNKVFGLHIK